MVITRNFVSFETVADLTLKYPWLFLTNLKTYEACLYHQITSFVVIMCLNALFKLNTSILTLQNINF